MRFVELEEARRTPGLRLVIARFVPSPWSQGAMGILDMKGLDYVAVRFRSRDEDIKQWTGAPNVPVALYDDEPPRTGWAEILQLAERLGGRISLIPGDDERRVRMFGLAHELLGENGLGWCVRLLLTHAGLVTEGREGWPAPVAAYLAPRYGYAADRVEASRARAVAILRMFGGLADESRSRGHDYLLGETPTALDVYAAVSLHVIALLPDEQCPLPPPLRRAFESLDASVRAAVSESLLAHRALMFQRHLAVPIRM